MVLDLLFLPLRKSMKELMCRPIRDMILLRPEPIEERTTGGILIPRNAKAKHTIGRVLAVGPGRVTDRGVRVEPEVKVGDRVLVREFHMAQAVERFGTSEGLVLVPEMDIDAILEG
jgi:chaperonin GroES